ncbi:MAG TPA: HprK-related kinase A [Stellaceae bacterium]|nr:HprK-related kinase A [Stellaceae bacterium]
MRVSDLSAASLAQRLGGGELLFRCGPFTARPTTGIASVVDNFRLLYTDYDLAEGFADFRFEIAPPAGLRRWIRPQVLFSFDGDRPFERFPADQAYPLFEWGFNWCIASTTNRYLIIHAAAVERGGRVLVLPGMPGSGKSTLTAALVSRGWRLFSDEMALVAIEGRDIVPIPRPISLKNESIAVIQSFDPAAVFGHTSHNTAKGSVSHVRVLTADVRRAGEVAQPGWIVFPHYESGAAATLTPRAKPATMLDLASNSFNYRILARLGFEMLCDVVERCDCYDFRYGNLDEAIAIFERLSERG